MATWKPDPSFYPSPRLAAKAPRETLAYVATFGSERKTPDKITVVDVDPDSPGYTKIVGEIAMPDTGDELHHFGWNACSSCLCPNAPHPHMERRYLVVPGLRSSRIHIIDTKPDPKKPVIVKTIEPEELAEKTGYTARIPCTAGRGSIYITVLGNADRKVPGGVLDQQSFDPLGRWEVDRGPQQLAYDGWWHLGYDTMVTSEWGHARHLRGWPRARIAAWREVRTQAALLGLHETQARAGSTSATNISSCSSCIPRTIRRRRTASSTA